jgi:hypothetical protein
LAVCHYNEEEISRHLKINKYIGYWLVQIQVCNRSYPGKTGRSCEGVDFS